MPDRDLGKLQSPVISHQLSVTSHQLSVGDDGIYNQQPTTSN
ncbi:MAG: hypothetical protein AAGA60_09380 [Cyanobacteria bacterium P01_E01_bin.42]